MSQFRIKLDWTLCRAKFNTIYLGFIISGIKTKINGNMHRIQFLRRQKWFRGISLMMFGLTRGCDNRENLRILGGLSKRSRLRRIKDIS